MNRKTLKHLKPSLEISGTKKTICLKKSNSVKFIPKSTDSENNDILFIEENNAPNTQSNLNRLESEGKHNSSHRELIRNNSDCDLFSISKQHEMQNHTIKDEPIQLIDDSTNLQLLLFQNCDLSEHLKYLEVVREEQILKNHSDLDITKISQQIRMNQNQINNDCTVCLEKMKNGSIVTVLFCGHVQHNECIQKWMSNSLMCPVCRYEFDKYQL